MINKTFFSQKAAKDADPHLKPKGRGWEGEDRKGCGGGSRKNGTRHGSAE